MIPDGSNGAGRIVDLTYVRARLERWVRWCLGARYQRNVSLTGRLMRGLRSNVCPGWLNDVQLGRGHDPSCPDCRGRGRLLLALRSRPHVRPVPCSICDEDGKIFGDWCYRCQGTRVVTRIDLEVNPAAIPGTRHVGGQLPDDVASAAIDELVSGWRTRDETVWCARIVIAEYFWNGDEEMKVRQLRVTQKNKAQRMEISLSFYAKRLRDAHFRTEVFLREKNL